MSSSARPVVHQDYIAKIRYSNALPPPPCPPKLLDIPNTGLSSGQYTSAGFASRLAREQPLNIEADAELGMSIDLVGIPKVFDGDESAIQAMPQPPPLHAADRALMRPPNALGKVNNNATSITFLRRTEYVTSSTTGGSKFESSNSTNTMRLRRKRKTAETSLDDPTNIARHILKGFNIAYPADAYNGQDSAENLRAADTTPEERQAWNKPKNPRNPSLKLLDSYPLLPDWDATPDTGGYMVFKFTAPPINNPLDPSYDARLDVALLRPAGQTIQDQDLYHQEREAHKNDHTAPVPIPRYQFEFFLPPSKDKVHGIKRNFTTHDPTNDADIDFDIAEDDEGQPRKCFKYENVRTYETSQQVGDPHDTYGDVVALALHDPERHAEQRLRDTKLQKAAYFYPIIQKTSIRPRRPGRVDLVGEEQKVDVIEAAGREPGGEAERREVFRRRAEGVEV
ncbi:Paf1-domain-containing protein [Cucurbitaria berberidis CBS 394.84]|uniref:Paf1-domain-containing protein n=1 Tax=Cucurbitaria berberidis CBS 394.84 TaxID=1168544 RepID=A0A9P4L5K3_9PLEO|nr:Paf1-domain-containing protein [Cucurbitaria berberidis CBS 394.84]KAF1842422.1 Paf1-domain-containing protein [Cucurbitaria berberidis CBS 394.84]